MSGVIMLTKEGGGFRVAPAPPDDRYPPRTFDTFKKANGAACGMRLVTGWTKIDRTGEA